MFRVLFGSVSHNSIPKKASKLINITGLHNVAYKRLSKFNDQYNEINEKLASGEVTNREMQEIRSILNTHP